MTRMLHLPDDPRAVEALDSIDMREVGYELASGRSDPLRAALEALAARGIVPDDWTHDERVYSLQQDWRVPALVLRNPRALITAERLLLDALDAAHADSVRRHGEHASRGRYVGVRSWEALCGQAYAGDRGSYLPSANPAGHEDSGARLDLPWISETRATGGSYGSPGALVWCMADQILGGPPWVTALYETGLGLWCWRDDYGAPQWALIVRPGDGMPWPRLARESAA